MMWQIMKDVTRNVEKNRQKTTRLLKELVKIRSITGDLKGYEEVASIIVEEMNSLGFSVKLMGKQSGRSNVVGKLTGVGHSLSLLFNGHIDVVPVPKSEKWIYDPFSGVVKDGRMFGRGTCDMKGGLAAMLMAARAVVDSGVTLGGNLILAATIDEEIGGRDGLKYVLEKGIRADAGVVCEPTSLKIVRACKAPLWIEIITKGKSAHGSMPEIGINAIEMMGDILLALKQLKFTCDRHEILGEPTINVGTINGGLKPNIVPENCRATLDIRILPTQTIERVLTEIKSKIEELREMNKNLHYDIRIVRHRIPVEIDLEEPIIVCLKDAVRTVTNRDCEFRGMVSPGDMEHLLSYEIPSVMFGAGNPELAHSANEWVDIDEVVAATKIYSLLMLKWLKTD